MLFILSILGSKNALRFRSPAEFIPHGYWLLTDPSLTKSNCGCKYCGGSGKKSQTEISEALGLPTNRGPSTFTRMRAGAPPRPRNPQKASAPRQANPSLDSAYIAPSLRRPFDPTDGWNLKSAKLAFASSDTRISDLTSSRRFRIGELVWCLFEEEKGNIYHRPFWPYWPAIVIDAPLHAEADVFDTNTGVYSVVQTRRYWLLRLGALSEEDYAQFEYLIDERDVLPWHALPSLANLTNIGPSEQTAAFFLGLHTARRLLLLWAVFNRHHIKLEESSATAKSESCSGMTTGQITSPSPPTPMLLDYDIPQRSPVRLASPKKRNRSPVFEKPQTPFSATTTSSEAKPTEVRYEGLWYGAERIWIGDTVRLFPEPEAFSDSLKASWENRPGPAPSFGAGIGGVLMRLDKIYVVGTESKEECVIAGQLYEVISGDDLRNPELEATYKRVTSPPVPEHNAFVRPWTMPSMPSMPPSHASFSTPLSPFPLPPAPSGYTLKPLLPANTEISAPVSLIAGRYYPDILQWLPRDLLSSSIRSNNAEQKLITQEYIHSLCGLAPGRSNPALCVEISLADRTRMIEDATEYARAQLELTSAVEEIEIG